MDLESKAAAAEGAFVLRPPSRTKQDLSADLQPTVGVSVTLRREVGTQEVHTRKILIYKISETFSSFESGNSTVQQWKMRLVTIQKAMKVIFERANVPCRLLLASQ